MIEDDLAEAYWDWFVLEARSKAKDWPTNEEISATLKAIRAIEKLVEEPDAVYYDAKARWKAEHGATP